MPMVPLQAVVVPLLAARTAAAESGLLPDAALA
jgi:hypothetical protein